MTGRARGAVPHRALLLVAWAAVAAGRACPLWQIIEPEVSRFNRVEGSLNGYALELRGDLQPTIRGKILQSYENGCPLSMSALESSGFSLETSESEPILVDYAEVKVGPAKIALTGLRAAMERHHFDASVSLCGPNENFGGPCFSGTISLRALTGNAHVLGHDIDLTGQVGNVDIRGYMDPDEQELRLQITWMHVNYDVRAQEESACCLAARSCCCGFYLCLLLWSSLNCFACKGRGQLVHRPIALPHLTRASSSLLWFIRLSHLSQVHTPEAHGNLELTGFLRAAAQLPFTFSFGARLP